MKTIKGLLIFVLVLVCIMLVINIPTFGMLLYAILYKVGYVGDNHMSAYASGISIAFSLVIMSVLSYFIHNMKDEEPNEKEEK